MILQCLRIILTLMALRQYICQTLADNAKLGHYWLIVALYWFVNFVQGLQ